MAYIKRGRSPADPLGLLLGDQHWPLPDIYFGRPKKYACIKVSTMTLIAVGEYRIIWNKALESTHPKDIAISLIDKPFLYDAFSVDQLSLLYNNLLLDNPDESGRLDLGDLEIKKKIAIMLKRVRAMPIPKNFLHHANPLLIWEPALIPQVKGRKQPGNLSRIAKRPPEGTATGRVWLISDKTLEANPNLSGKALREMVLKACLEAGINKATAMVQFNKWRATIK